MTARTEALIAWPCAVLLVIVLAPFMLWATLNERRWARTWRRALAGLPAEPSPYRLVVWGVAGVAVFYGLFLR